MRYIVNEDIINHEGEKCMCGVEPMLVDETKELDYPVKRYFDLCFKELESDKEEKIKKIIKETDLYKAAKSFEDVCKKNNPLSQFSAYDMCLYNDSLPLGVKKKIEKVRDEFEEKMNKLSDTCRLVSNLVNQADTFKERMIIMKDYDIL